MEIRRILIIIGLMLVLTGLLWPWLGKIPFGHLPGDILIERPNFKIYIPITTMILISLALSILVWLFRR